MGDQIRRAVISVPTNIAEGQARRYPAEFARYLPVVRGSLAELDTLILAAGRLDYFEERDSGEFAPAMIEMRRLLQGLIQVLGHQRGQ